MFAIQKGKFGNLDYHKLINLTTGEYIALIPEFGGILNEFVIQKGNQCISLIEGYENEKELETLYGLYFKSAKLSPFPNRIYKGQYNFAGKKYQLPLNFPSEGNSLHGLFLNKKFEVKEITTDSDGASMTLSAVYNQDLDSFPFHYQMFINYIYHSKEGLTCITDIQNLGEETIPLGDGWHPYFSMETSINELYLQFQAESVLGLNEDKIPTGSKNPYFRFQTLEQIGKRQFDECFLLKKDTGIALTTLTDAKRELKIHIWQETGKNKYNYLQIFTPPDRKSIALEPMTCPPDVLNNEIDLIRLSPKEKLSLSWGIKIS